MYIKNILVQNIGSINNAELSFNDAAAGWHVVLGDNGTGKSSLLRAIATALVGPEQIPALNIVRKDFLKKGKKHGLIELEILPHKDYDISSTGRLPSRSTIKNLVEYKKEQEDRILLETNINSKKLAPNNYNWSDNFGWFSSSFGPFRRFSGGDEKRNKVFYSNPKAGAHLSLFGEDVALTEALDWLKDLDNRRLRTREKLTENEEFL